jgi:hypothetical protein
VTLAECLDKHLKPGTVVVEDTACCHRETVVSLTKIVERAPEFLFITLDRTLEVEGFKKRMDKVVKYETAVSGIGKKGSYELYAVIFLEGPNRYKSLLQAQKGNWLEYDGEHVAPANKKDVLMRNADVLVYRQL